MDVSYVTRQTALKCFYLPNCMYFARSNTNLLSVQFAFIAFSTAISALQLQQYRPNRRHQTLELSFGVVTTPVALPYDAHMDFIYPSYLYG